MVRSHFSLRSRVLPVVLPVALSALMVGCAAEPATTTATPSPSESSPSSTSSASSNGEAVTVAVYWLGESKASTWLFRESARAPDEGDPITTAVAAMMSLTPADPDLSTPWSKPSDLAVTQSGDAITVDVSADAFANSNIGSAGAERAIQELVWTATDAANAPGPVTILVDGAPYDAWGAVRLGEPIPRDEDARAPIWVDSPTEGEQVPAGGPTTVGGSANVFEGLVVIEVTDADGKVGAKVNAEAAMGEYRDFEVAIELPPGAYTISAYSPDESGGEGPEGPRGFEVTRTFTVL